MTHAQSLEESHVRKRPLDVPSARAPLARHPDDGFVLARPYPLGPASLRALNALIVAICPPPPAPTAPDMIERVAAHVRHFMSYMPPLAGRGFWLCMMLLDWAPLFLFAASSRLHKLSPARASALLTEMVSGRYAFLRTVVVAIRGLILNAYFDQDEVHRAIGYEPLPFIRERIERRQQLLVLQPARAHAGGMR